MLNANDAVTVWVHSKLLTRILAAVGVATLFSLIIIMNWQALTHKSTTSDCVFMIPDHEVSTGRSFTGSVGSGQCVGLGRASAPQDLEQGLSGRSFMPIDEGLLFDFGAYAKHCMWMRDMRFILDIIWLDNSKTINHIESNVTPKTYPNTYCGNGDSWYVIEVNAGVARMAKLKIGQKLNF